jgi:hypothetical protein
MVYSQCRQCKADRHTKEIGAANSDIGLSGYSVSRRYFFSENVKRESEEYERADDMSIYINLNIVN